MKFEPNPEHILKMMERLKDAYRKAADAETGDAQELFERQYQAFLKSTEPTTGDDGQPDWNALIKSAQEQFSLQRELMAAAQNNPAARAAMNELNNDMRDAMKAFMQDTLQSLSGGIKGFDLGSLLGGKSGGLGDIFGKFGGKGDNSPGPDADDDITPPPSSPKKPRFPGGGKDFDLD